MDAARAMADTIFAHPRSERPFALALAVSLIVHAGALMVSLPAAKRPPLASLLPLEVWLAAPEEPPAPAVTMPVAPRLEPPKPKPRPREAQRPAMAEMTAPSPAPAPMVREAPVEVPVPSAVPNAEAPVAAPTPQPTAPLPVAAVALPSVPSHALLEGYGRSISELLARYKEYPRIAQMRGWQGSVTMRLRVAATGRLIDATLYSSSGYEVLDQQALAIAHKPERLPAPPGGLRNDDVWVLVPVVFRLARE